MINKVKNMLKDWIILKAATAPDIATESKIQFKIKVRTITEMVATVAEKPNFKTEII